MKAGGRGGVDYDLLGAPLGSQLYFAGEATCREHPATAAGAFLTGLRAAASAVEAHCAKSELLPLPGAKREPKYTGPVVQPVKLRADAIMMGFAGDGQAGMPATPVGSKSDAMPAGVG
jgi:hypothetical protein